ncbi:BcpO-related WXXGXW repeat protein [Spirosoma aureum]|uniref:BcpO-related WXXGXW repeat protein n=1 Tax=Spirosoma aureum TaxID=2692134 RepID=A0A6G9ALM3_9BACT|nr:YXWGXW repeat-containing protein [Spirosoma aureum]QIP13371.1 BcpO-related WXXGXW repeat protein [Spirosoma aureum]
MKTNVKVLALASLLLPALCTIESDTATAQTPSRVIVIPSTPPMHKAPIEQVWVPGHYVQRGRDRIWINGHYQTVTPRYATYSKPDRYKTWNPGYWRQTPRGRVWVEGYWSY